MLCRMQQFQELQQAPAGCSFRTVFSLWVVRSSARKPPVDHFLFLGINRGVSLLTDRGLGFVTYRTKCSRIGDIMAVPCLHYDTYGGAAKADRRCSRRFSSRIEALGSSWLMKQEKDGGLR